VRPSASCAQPSLPASPWQSSATPTAPRGTPPLGNAAVANALEQIAALLEREAPDRVQAAACQHAAQTLRHDVRPLSERIDDDGVEGVHRLGISYELSGQITDWVRTGAIGLLQQLEHRRDARNALEVMPGIGARLASEVELALGVTDVAGLARASEDGRLATLCGFGPRRLELIAGVVAAMPHDRRPQRHRSEQLVMPFCR
jgi:DNA polymerase (family X)